MNMESMRVRSYRSIAANEHVPEEAAECYRTLKACGNLRAAGCSEESALEQLGISRRTRYRWQGCPTAGRLRDCSARSFVPLQDDHLGRGESTEGLRFATRAPRPAHAHVPDLGFVAKSKMDEGFA